MSALLVRFVIALAALASYITGGINDAPWYLMAWPLLVVGYIQWRFMVPATEARELGRARHSTQEQPGCPTPQNRNREATP